MLHSGVALNIELEIRRLNASLSAIHCFCACLLLRVLCVCKFHGIFGGKSSANNRLRVTWNKNWEMIIIILVLGNIKKRSS